jgi:hypothetical protein
MPRLSDEDLRQIFSRIDEPDCETTAFVKAFAHAVCLAPRRDFLLLRPIAIVMIGKYNLGPHCERAAEEISAPRIKHCELCDDTSWRPIEINGDRRVKRCDCVRPQLAADPPARPVSAQVSDYKSAAAGDR